MPCLILLYSGIEIVARMGGKPHEKTRSYFIRWVDKYILAHGRFDVTALDLYAARCGMVHEFSPDSDLYRDGKARRISYSWGNASVQKVKGSITSLSHDIAAIHLNEFTNAFMRGIPNFMDDLGKDRAAQERAEEVRSAWFTRLPTDVLDSFIAVTAATSKEQNRS